MLHIKHNRLTLNCECITCIEKKIRRQKRKMSSRPTLSSSVSQAEQNPGQATISSNVNDQREAIVEQESKIKQEAMELIFVKQEPGGKTHI